MSIGSKESEVACMGSLTANLHLMMNSFYKPTSERFKILCEAKAFPSDQVSFSDSRLILFVLISGSIQYAFASQAIRHALDPQAAVLALSPRREEYTLRTSDILDVINKEGDEIAVVIFSGVQYYTGQLFDMEAITRAAKARVRMRNVCVNVDYRL